MQKLVLCIVVILSSLAVGWYLSFHLSERVRVLDSYLTLLEEAGIRMSYTSAGLAEVFSSNFADYPFRSGCEFFPQWSDMTSKHKHALNTGDINLINRFGEHLGESDLSSEMQRIKMFRQLIEERRDSAKAEEQKKTKLYRVLPLAVGIITAILLI